MKIIKALFKIFLISVMLVAIATASIFLYMKYYGQDAMEGVLSKTFGSKIKFDNISLSLDKHRINFKGFSIPGKINLDEKVFNAKKFTLVLDEEVFNEEKRVAVKKVIVTEGMLNLEKDASGIFTIVYDETKKINPLGSKIKFKSALLNLETCIVNFRGFSVLNEFDPNEKIFSTERFDLILDKEIFDSQKKIVVKKINITGGELNIERDERGTFKLASNTSGRSGEIGDTAYADEFGTTNGSIYNFAKIVNRLTLKNFIIKVEDYYIPVLRRPFVTRCYNFNLDINSSLEPDPSTGAIALRGQLSFGVPNSQYSDGEFSLNATMAVYEHKIDTEAVAQATYIDLMQFRPYFELFAPFSFSDGLFSSITKFRMHNRMIDTLTTMTFHRLRLARDPSRQDTRFLSFSAERLIPYLMSGQGEIILDFFIKGPIENPQVKPGPKVKYAMGMVAVEELGSLIQQLQNL